MQYFTYMCLCVFMRDRKYTCASFSLVRRCVPFIIFLDGLWIYTKSALPQNTSDQLVK